MMDVSLTSYITAFVMLTALVLLDLCFHIRAKIYQVFIRFLPLGRIESFITKFNEVALVVISSVTTYNIGWPGYLLLVPTIMKWSCYCLGISHFKGKQVQVQQGQGHQDGGDNKEDEINLDYEKEKSYVKAAFGKYPNLTNDELRRALKHLQSQGLFDKRDVVDLCHAINHIKVNGQEIRQVTSVDSEPTFQQQGHSRRELVEILVTSNKYDRRDIEDVINRYYEQHGEIPTMEQFVEFHGGLKADLEAKLETEKRKLVTEKRKVDSNYRTIEDKDRKLQDKDRKLQDKDRTIEDFHKTVQDKDRTIQDNQRTIQDNQRTIQDNKKTIGRLENRLLCKICMDNEMSIVCIPCGHLYCCSSPQCRNDLTTRGKCHICQEVVTGQIQTRLA